LKKIQFNDNKNVISENVRKYRKLKGMSQAELAARLQTMGVNMDQQMLSKIENNSRIVTDYELACLCIIFEIDAKEILSDFLEKYEKEL